MSDIGKGMQGCLLYMVSVNFYFINYFGIKLRTSLISLHGLTDKSILLLRLSSFGFMFYFFHAPILSWYLGGC